METEKRSTQLWQRLRLAAAMKELDVLGKSDSWSQLEHEDDDPRPETKEPLVKGWRWLKAVSMMVFSGRAYHKTEMVPLCKPAKSGSDNSVAEAKTDVGATRPQLKTTAQVQLLIPSQDPAGLGINNSAPDVVVDLPSCRRRSPAPQPAQVVAVHAPTVDQMKEQGRCLKYSQKALSFAVCTFIGFASSAKPTGNTTFKLAIAPFFVAICADLYSLKTKAKLGTALVYLSSFHLVLMIYIVFISFNMHYAYTIPFLPLVAGASLLQQKIWPEGQQKSTDEKVSKDLDSIFELSTLILNWSTFITAILAIFRRVHLIPEPNKYVTFNVVGLLFFLTIVLGLYLMLVTTVRSVALNLRSKYLDVLLICLLVSTLIAALIMFT